MDVLIRLKTHAARTKKNLQTGWMVLRGAPPAKNFILTFGLCLVLSVTFLLIASKSSPLYPLNDWVDPHAFFTMGRGMLRGLVPYRDLFEQKGPLLYFVHGLASLISENTFLGVFIFEVLFFTIFLFYAHQLIGLFVDWQYALLALPWVTTAILNLRSFAHGGSAEQFTLPFLMISLYYLVRYFKSEYPRPLPYRWAVINGLIAGCVLWIKYSFLGFWFGWMVVILIGMLIHKHWQAVVKSSLWFLGGMLIATLPWLAYFGAHGAIGYWIETYIIINLTSYPVTFSLVDRLRVPLLDYRRHVSFNPLAIGLLLFGLVMITTNRKYLKNLIGRAGLVLCVGLLILGVYGGGRSFIYYFFIFAPLTLFGFIVIADLYQQAYEKTPSRLLFFGFLFTSILVTLPYTLRYHRNTYMLDWELENMVQYEFASILNQADNPSLLNYSFPDGGFYTVAGLLPQVRFFQSQNILPDDYPLWWEEHNRYIVDQEVDFIVMRYPPDVDPETLPIPHLYENYHLIRTRLQYFGDIQFKYLLFEKTTP